VEDATISSTKFSIRWLILAAIVVLAVLVTAALKPTPQPTWYHDFADKRSFARIPNAGDVLSNLFFVIVGLAGVYYAARTRAQTSRQRSTLIVLFLGLFLTGFGSAYYHLAPDNQRLLWDRLPMTIAMAGVITFLLENRLRSVPRWVLPTLVLIGLGSVLHWSWSESRGFGDLRWYVLFQVLTFIVGVLLLVMFPARNEPTRAVVIILVANIAAKILESLDKPIYAASGIVSGHTLKHLAAGLGFIPLVAWLARENRMSAEK